MNTQSPSGSSSANSHNDDGNNPLGVLDFDPTLFDPSAAFNTFLEAVQYGSFGRSYQPQYAYPAQNAAAPYYGPSTGGNAQDLALLGLANDAVWPALDASLAGWDAGGPNLDVVPQGPPAPPAMHDQQQLPFTNPPLAPHQQQFGNTELFANPPFFVDTAAYPPPTSTQQALGPAFGEQQGAMPWQFRGHEMTAPPDAGPHMPPPPRHEPSPSARRPRRRQATTRQPRRRAAPEPKPFAAQQDTAAIARPGAPKSRASEDGAPPAPRRSRAAQLSEAGEEARSLSGSQATTMHVPQWAPDLRAAQRFWGTLGGRGDGQQGADATLHHLDFATSAPELRDVSAVTSPTQNTAPTRGRGRKRAHSDVDGEYVGPAPRQSKKARSAPAAAGSDDAPGQQGKQEPNPFMQFRVRVGPAHESIPGETSGAGSSNLGRNVQNKNNCKAHSGTQEDGREVGKITIWDGPESERPTPEKGRRYTLDEPRPEGHDWYCRVCRDRGVRKLYWQDIPKARLHVKREHPEDGEPRHVVERGKGSGTKRKKQPPKDEERREDEDKDKEGEE